MALIATCLVASSNYVLNELLDGPQDRLHPVKRHRPVPSGQVKPALAYAEWIGLAIVGLGLAWSLNRAFFWSALWLWVMGVLYNVPPIRMKEWPYVDVLSESINNPIRLFLGWFALISDRVPPLSLALSYWMIGAFFMAMKRYAEYRHIGDPAVAAAYRHSFKYYNEERLLVSILFYATTCALFAGIFVVRYHLELLLFVPQAAGLFAYYLHLGMKPDSPTQNPEKLYRERGFVAYLDRLFRGVRAADVHAGAGPLRVVQRRTRGHESTVDGRTMISVVIPVRNGAAHLPRCLTSIAANAWPAHELEIVVVDNGSSDDSGAVARRYGARVVDRPGVRVGACRNAGAVVSRGDILAFVDADHEIGAGWLRACASAFQESRAGAVGYPCHPPADATWVQQMYDALRAKSGDRRDVEWLGAGNLAVRRNVFEQVGGFDERLEACEDVQLCHKVRQAGYRIVSEPGMDNVHYGDPQGVVRPVFGRTVARPKQPAGQPPGTFDDARPAQRPSARRGFVVPDLAGVRPARVAVAGQNARSPRRSWTGRRRDLENAW